MLIVNYEILCIGLIKYVQGKKKKPLKVQITCKILVMVTDVPEFNAIEQKLQWKWFHKSAIPTLGSELSGTFYKFNIHDTQLQPTTN